MSDYYYKFGPSDVFYNRIETHPKNEFLIFNSQVFYNKKSKQSGSLTASVPCVEVGFINLHELNVDRSSDRSGFIHPYVVKTSKRSKLSTTTAADFDRKFSYGQKMTGSYRLSASIGRQYFSSGLEGGTTNYTGSALKNTFNYYQKISPLYAYTSSAHALSYLNKASDASCLVTVPSIFYGSSIKKGTVDLKFFITGTLMGRVQDIRSNGELVQTEPVGSTGSGSVAGMVLYNEGFVYLSGSWSLDPATYTFDGGSNAPKWIHFGGGANDGVTTSPSASFFMAFSGTNYVPNITALAHARKGELNHSNNFSYIKHNQVSALGPFTGSTAYFERDLTIKNTVSSSYLDPTGSFQKKTYISKIGIYDDDKNLIAIASLAKPVKKTEERDLTFKLKLDI